MLKWWINHSLMTLPLLSSFPYRSSIKTRSTDEYVYNTFDDTTTPSASWLCYIADVKFPFSHIPITPSIHAITHVRHVNVELLLTWCSLQELGTPKKQVTLDAFSRHLLLIVWRLLPLLFFLLCSISLVATASARLSSLSLLHRLLTYWRHWEGRRARAHLIRFTQFTSALQRPFFVRSYNLTSRVK